MTHESKEFLTKKYSNVATPKIGDTISIWMDAHTPSGNYSGVLSLNGVVESYDQSDWDGSKIRKCIQTYKGGAVYATWTMQSDGGSFQMLPRVYNDTYGGQFAPTSTADMWNSTCDPTHTPWLLKMKFYWSGIKEDTPTYFETLDKIDQWSTAQYIPRNALEML